MNRDRLIVVDSNLGKSLAARLRDRGRNAVSTAQLHLEKGVEDPDVLRGLADLYNGKEDWVLVTGDDTMPAEHGPVILETKATIATVHPDRPEGMNEHAWLRDVVHRQAHNIQTQEPQAVRRYSFSASHVWRPRRRHQLLIQRHGWTPWQRAKAQTAN